eukprot:7324528-Pyramimonas_sp.AAC.1
MLPDMLLHIAVRLLCRDNLVKFGGGRGEEYAQIVVVKTVRGRRFDYLGVVWAIYLTAKTD